MNKSTHPLYQTWIDIRRRCRNQKYKDYPNYGGRGIKISEEWFNSFETFAQDMGERPKNHSIDRIDVNGNYCKENCRWATQQEQSANKRKKIFTHTFMGETLTEKQWANKLGISYSAFRMRKSMGWSIEKILTTPPGRWPK